MALPLDDILKAIAKGGGPGAQIARTAVAPTVRAAPQVAAMGPTWGKLAGKGLLAGYTPPQVAQHERREGPGGAFGAALTAIDLGRGIMVSTIKESIDLLQGEGIHPDEWWNQATTQYGFGELIHDERNWVGGMLMATSPFTGGVGLALGAGVLANNIWADRIIGFIGDVAVDPLMYLGGFGAFARGAGYLGAIGQLGDIAKVAKAAGKMTTAKEVAIKAATEAAGLKKSLSAASRELAKHGDVGKALIKELGWSPGVRIRAPFTGPGGRMVRKVGGAGDRVWDVGSRLRGKPSWITANRVKQIPKYYDDMFDKRTLTEMVEAFGKGRAATAVALKKFEREFAKKAGPARSLDMVAALERVAGQAAKAPLELALPGLRFGRAAGAAGLGGRFISQVADAPIRGTHLVTTKSARDKVALLFEPQGALLRAMFDSGDAEKVATAAGIRNAQRFAAGRAKFAERDINAATQKALTGVRRKGISDTNARRLEAALRGKDVDRGRIFAYRNPTTREITGIDTTTHWFRNLPEDLQEMYRTDREKFMSIARAIDQRLDTVQQHKFTAYGDDFGDNVFEKEGAVYSGHRQINRDFQQAITGEEPPKLQGKRGYPVRGRAVPGSVKEREYFTGGPLKIEEPDLLPPVATGRRGVVQGIDTTTKKPMVTGDGDPIYVLADELGDPFVFKNPDEVGMSFDAQVNRVTQQTFGKSLYEERYSMLSHLEMRNIETDIKLYTLMRKIEEDGIAAVAGPDELRLFRALIKDLKNWDELGREAADAKVARLKIQDQVDNRRANETTAGRHAANREADAARLSAKGVEAAEEAVNVDIQLNDAMLVLARMQEDLGLVGAESAEINRLAEQTRLLVEAGERIGKQKTIRGEMLSKRDSITEEAVLHQQRVADLKQLLDDLDRLRPELERVIADDIGRGPGKWTKIVDELPEEVDNKGRRAKHSIRFDPTTESAAYDAEIIVSRGSAPGRVEVEWAVPQHWLHGFPDLPGSPPGRSLDMRTRTLMTIFKKMKSVTDEMLAEGLIIEGTVAARKTQLRKLYKKAGFKELPGRRSQWDVAAPSTEEGDLGALVEHISIIKEPQRVRDAGGRFLPRGLETDLAAAREAVEPVERAYTEALAVHTAAEEAVEAAEAAYEANVWKALGARPAAERTAAVARELEAKAARTAVPDIGADPAVWSARLELEDAEAALRSAAEYRRALRERVAVLEAQPGYRADVSAEGLAVEPLQHANYAANESVLTPAAVRRIKAIKKEIKDLRAEQKVSPTPKRAAKIEVLRGQQKEAERSVKAGAHQARLGLLVEDVAGTAKDLNDVMKAADKNAPKPKSTETPAQKAAATKKRKAAELAEQQAEELEAGTREIDFERDWARQRVPSKDDIGEGKVLTDFLDEGAAAVPAAKSAGAPVRTMPAATANEIKALRAQITELVPKERALTAQLEPQPFPMARRGAVHRELEEAQAALAEAKTNKLRGQKLRRDRVAAAEAKLAAAPKGHTRAAREARAVAQDRVDAAKIAKEGTETQTGQVRVGVDEAGEGLYEERTYTVDFGSRVDDAQARVDAAQQAVDGMPPEAATKTVKQIKTERTRLRNKIRDLRDKANALTRKDATLTRKALIEAGDYYPPDHRWRAADTKKVAAKRRKVAKANANLRAESSPEVKGTLAYKVAEAAKVLELRAQRDEAQRALEVLERRIAVVEGTGRASIPPGRLEAARTRVRGETWAVADAEARAAKDGGPVRIVGESDPRVRNPRLYAQGPNGRGLVKIPRPKDAFGDDFGLLRVVREGDGWKFTHLKQDLTGGMTQTGWKGPAGGRQNALIRAARRTSPKRDELRQQGWRFFDEDVAEGSTRISGEAAQARQAATEAARPLREATEGAAEAQRVMGQTVPPRPDLPATTYADRPALTKAFNQSMKTARSMLTEVQHQLKLITASLFKFAEDDVTTQAMRELQNLLEGMKRGAVGAEGLTASARMNRYMRNLSELDRLQKAVDFERTLGVDKMPDVRTRLDMLNKEIARIGEERGVATRLEDLVPGQPLQRRVPVLSQEQLATLQGKQEIIDDLAKQAKNKLDEAAKWERKAAEAKRLGEKWRADEAKAATDVLAIEAGALTRALELEIAAHSKVMSASAGRRVMKGRIGETVERLDRDDPFLLRSTDKDVINLSKGVEAKRAALGVTDRAPLVEEKKLVDRTLKEVLDIAYSIEPRGYSPTAVKGKLFQLNADERKLAQEYLKSSLSSNEWGPWTLSQGHPFKEEMQAVIRGFANVNDPSAWDGSTGLWKTWDNFQTYLKAAMIATPGFVNRNIFGAFFNAWLDDVNPAEIIRSMHMTFAVAKRARNEGIGFYTAAKKMAKSNPKYKQYVELLDVGVRGGGQAIHSVELEVGLRNAMDLTLLVGGRGRNPATAVSLAPWSPRFVGFQSIRSVNSWVEDIVRLGVGMDTMRWGGNVDDALKRIAKSQFDYDELTQFERRWMRRFFPFYTWTRKNVPYQLDQLARNPAKFNKILAGKRNLELGTEEEDLVPDYFLEPFGVRLPIKYKGATVYSAPDFPFQDLARYDPFDRERGGLKEVSQNVASMLTPILKAPLETAFGKQLYNGVPFTGRYQLAPASISKFPGMKQALQAIGWIKQGPSGEWKMRDHHIYLITNMLPTLGVLRRLAPNEPKYQRAYLRTLMSTLGGVSASFNTDEAKNNWLTNLRYERQEDRQRWKDLTSQTR